ncbi:right-handed parallel beta-helix repeat-containing protein [Deinococcus hopiensis]|uniref:Right handed beta helix region n=1 Tax=Deinococcus hopiensis KR-140 TaxID=695939 RepID=A0A1W1USF6_9DEIO|nr:right-handed parallel beta-helix repeat-containing protein [Deinococcus hopiensis]SMB84027.1 hypothetical protein SAMN00790413_04971 [Deinococcus hopiensis KR-140]
MKPTVSLTASICLALSLASCGTPPVTSAAESGGTPTLSALALPVAPTFPVPAPQTLPGPATPELTVPVDCRATGTGRDIQVGNPVPASGAGTVQVASLGAVDWNRLGPGDTVRVFWRATPYFEKFTISTGGTAAQPLRVCGVPGPGGALPVISGRGATTRTDLNAGSLSSGIQDLAVISVFNPDYSKRPEHVVIEGLRVQDTLAGAGAARDTLSYTATNGALRRYDPAAACIRVQEGQDITLRGNTLTGCGNGLFVLSRVPEAQMSRDLVIEGNNLYGNGVVNNYYVHNAYVQGVNVLVQFNRFGSNRSGALGGNLKMRTAGDVIRYNAFEPAARILDLVEVQDHAELVIPRRFAALKAQSPDSVTPGDDARVAQAWAAYKATFVYGNFIRNAGAAAATHLIHYSYDNQQDDRRPGTLYFYDNTVVSPVERSTTNFVRLLDGGPWTGNSDLTPMVNASARPEGYALTRVWNNVFVLGGVGVHNPAYWEFARYRADRLALGHNFVSAGWNTDPYWGAPYVFPGLASALVDPAYTYAGANNAPHITGVTALVTAATSPVDVQNGRPINPALLTSEGTPVTLMPELTPTWQIDPQTMTRLVRPTTASMGARE